MLLGPYQELIGVDIRNKVIILEESNKTVFQSLEPPTTFSDLPMLLGMFRLYALWISFFEVQVLPWQILLKQGHKEGEGEAVQYYIIRGMWNNKDITLMDNI